MENQLKDIDPALKHLQPAIDEAARDGDTEKLRTLIESAGLEWLDPPLPEKYRSGHVC